MPASRTWSSTLTLLALLTAACAKPLRAPEPAPARPMSLATVRRMVESMLGQTLRVQQLSSLESCLLRLVATPAGHTELAAIADASPFAAWDATRRVFFYSHNDIFPDMGSTLRTIGPDSRDSFSLWVQGGLRCVHLDYTDGRLWARAAIPTTPGYPIPVFDGRNTVVLIPGHEYDLLYERGRDATSPLYELLATRIVD